ncbi:DinB family protein [Streptomyces sp. NRRL WC-3742]|uniref:DinB family protein n=1 Tax=Streptomyces sp. NRRL WC-3742 TaxID=1463934 RepID=UPI0004C941F5|nr:DinB family protein [Streptomyces sp. NRRL WC-3742]
MTIATATRSTSLTDHLLHHYDLAHEMVLQLAEDFDDETARLAPAPHKPLVWFLGHLTCATDYFSTLHQGTESLVTEEFSLFFAGNDNQDWSLSPSLDEMVAKYKAVHARMRDFVETLTDADLDRESPLEPVGDDRLKNLGKALSIIQMHDAYHCGQIGCLRVALGKHVPF